MGFLSMLGFRRYPLLRVITGALILLIGLGGGIGILFSLGTLGQSDALRIGYVFLFFVAIGILWLAQGILDINKRKEQQKQSSATSK
jgi:hypothetical protein